jgi:hypothetical protein
VSEELYDVFISYSSKDVDWVKGILMPKLESHSFRVFIDFRDFRTGSASVAEMQRGVVESRRTLLVLSPHYVQSDWTTFENVMAQTLDPAAQQRRIVPVLLARCDMPLRLRILHYRNLSDNDEEQWTLLIRDLI